jgi:hypothetical protein
MSIAMIKSGPWRGTAPAPGCRTALRVARVFLVGFLGCLLSAAESGFSAEPADAGPLFQEFELTLAPGRRFEAAGPFFYREQRGTQQTWAVPPFLSHAWDPETESEEFDFLYPLLTYDRYGSQYRWQFFQLLSCSGGPSQEESFRDRFTLFPLYFQQRSADPKENYTALIPFYGHLKKRLFRDEVFFVMFPFYSQTLKGDVVTDNYLVPFFHLRHGPGLRGWQFWPLIGHEHKAVTTRTNRFEELETIPGHEEFFALWPLYFNQHIGVGSDNPVWQQGILPLYALERSPKRDSTTVIWPFFSRVDDREKKYREWDAPWPLIVFAQGEGKTTRRVWPLFSHAHDAALESDFFLWPVYKHGRTHSAPLESQRTRIFFYLYSDLLEQNTETGKSMHRVDFWPLFTRRRNFDGSSRLQVLSLLEPFLPGSHKVERDYSPVWALWRAEDNPATGRSSQSLLWNLYRREVTPTQKKDSLFFGLFQYQSDSAGNRLRLFYLPVGQRKAPEFEDLPP